MLMNLIENFFPMNLIKNWSDQATVYRLFTLCCPINSLWKSQSLFKSDLPFNLHILIINSTKDKANRLISNSRNKNWFFSDIHILIHWQCLPKGHFYSRVYFFCTPRPKPTCFQCHARKSWTDKVASLVIMTLRFDGNYWIRVYIPFCMIWPFKSYFLLQ